MSKQSSIQIIASLLAELFTPDECSYELLERLAVESGGHGISAVVPDPGGAAYRYFAEVARTLARRGFIADEPLFKILSELRPRRADVLQRAARELSDHNQEGTRGGGVHEDPEGAALYLVCESWRLPNTVRWDLGVPVAIHLARLASTLEIPGSDMLSSVAGNMRRPLFLHQDRPLKPERSLRDQAVQSGDTLQFVVEQTTYSPGAPPQHYLFKGVDPPESEDDGALALELRLRASGFRLSVADVVSVDREPPDSA